MRSIFIILALALAVPAQAAEPLQFDAIFAAWAESQGDVKSLTVEFRLSDMSHLGHVQNQSNVVLRAIRGAEGDLQIAADISEVKFRGRDVRPKVTHLLFVNERVYELHPDTKTAYWIDVRAFDDSAVALPLLPIVERSRVDERYVFDTVKEDAGFYYVMGEPRRGKVHYGKSQIAKITVAINKQSTVQLPRYTPHTIWLKDAFDTYTIVQTQKWLLDTQPNEADFVRPEDRSDWEVRVHPAMEAAEGIKNAIEDCLKLLFPLPEDAPIAEDP